MSLFTELKRRNVVRMVGLYPAGAWLLIQAASTMLPAFDAPACFDKFVLTPRH